MNYIRDDELKHYGVLGMRWGHRKRQEKTSKDTSDSEQDTKKGLTDKQKKAIKVGAVAAASILAVYGGYKLSQNQAFRNSVSKVVNKKSNDEADRLIKEKLKSVNPLHTRSIYDPNYIGSNMNCGLTTIAEELTMRGESCYAGLHTAGMYPEHLGSYFKGLHSKSISTLNLGKLGDANNIDRSVLRGERIRNQMEKHVLKTFPEGSRGNIYIPHINGPHYMSFENLGNRVRFDNPQDVNLNITEWLRGAVTSGTASSNRYEGIRFTRLDDLEINRDTISEVISKTDKGMESSFDINIMKGANFVMKFL